MKPQSCMIHPVLHQVNGTPTNLRKFEEKKIEVAEASLGNRTREWFLMVEELNELARKHLNKLEKLTRL